MSYLPYDEWLPLAETLEEGRRKRVDHTCGKGNTLLITHTEDGYTGHCFRCNLGGFKPHGVRRISDIDFRLLREADDEFRHAALCLPEDYTQDIPTKHATWIYKAGVFDDTAKAYGFGWSESMARVILPVYEDGQLIYLQARAVDSWRKPKYLNLEGESKGGAMWKGIYEDTMGLSGDAGCSDSAVRPVRSGAVFVTEDILSALRVYLCGYNAVSTLGTAVSDAQAAYLSRFKHIVFWYDGDDAGYKGSAKGMKKLNLVTETSRITTSKDPKLYSNREINEIIGRHAQAVLKC